MKDDKIPDLELEDNCKVKLKVKPKIDFNALKEGKLRFKHVDLSGELKYKFENDVSMSLDGKARIKDGDIKLESANIEFSKRF